MKIDLGSINLNKKLKLNSILSKEKKIKPILLNNNLKKSRSKSINRVRFDELKNTQIFVSKYIN